MALRAISFDGYLVRTHRLLRNYLVVARQADCARRSSQKLSVNRCMRIVASDAFGRLHRGVHKLALELFLEIVMAIEAKLSFCSRLQSELILILPRSTRDDQDGEHRES